ncbi:kinase-like protein [Basidiobolus meristosporus CBS 931.73]|uniref:Kinase-like protein n=1 Tax=Basidiobolus meristosporus CBS 931.73 TaxID=1314790 RepID=A0A1Y1ZCM8_9FUNG|nr:kinase-like protein [Basidiobolus meristosporus CBS 931.73]|eukprot:ORY07966.1 kinase-like protein [Basidiobolus meristosporus CBS 931.73]
MGNRIGKGQFGTVYKALNLENGQIVAVKRMKIIDHKEYIDSLMNEVELLKSLSHPQIVKYEGSIRTDDSLYIVIEYVENGSLLKTLKDFGGRFPEKLVKKYALKILEGLMYLHDQKVVHCDLKAANILSTKNGNIKLSDFGVSLNLKLLESNLTNVSANPTVAGTPNWMAPEIIELQGASTASDIWSLGCTIVELLTGKPPYYDLMPLTALFRIVEDDCPPLPENISDKMRSFLLQCFQKDPSMRPTARELYRHDWLVEHRVVHVKHGSMASKSE